MSTQSKTCSCANCPDLPRTRGWRDSGTVLRAGCQCGPVCACGPSCRCQAA